MQATKLIDGKVCYCAIGAGGKPCVDRSHCDKNGNRYFAEQRTYAPKKQA